MDAVIMPDAETPSWSIAPEWAWLLQYDPADVVFTLVEDDGSPGPPRSPRDGWAEAAAALAIEEEVDPERDEWLAFDDGLDLDD